MKSKAYTHVVPLLLLAAMYCCHPLSAAQEFVVVSESLQLTEYRVPVDKGHGDLVDVSIDISYREKMSQKDYPDFIQLKQDLRDWTDNYNWTPDPEEPPVYWEVLARDLSIKVIENYPTINRAAIAVKLYPTASYSYERTLRSVATRPEDASTGVSVDLSLVLPIESFGIDHQGPQVIDLITELHYAPGLGPREYPGFKDVYTLIFELMEDYPVETDYWETLVKSMHKDLLRAYPQYNAVSMDMRVYPTEALPYFHSIQTTTVRH